MANLVSSKTAVAIRNLIDATDGMRQSDRPSGYSWDRRMQYSMRIVRDGAVYKAQFFASGAIWEFDGATVDHTNLTNAQVGALPWYELGVESAETVWAVLRDTTPKTVAVVYASQLAAVTHKLDALPIGALEAGPGDSLRVRQYHKGVIWGSTYGFQGPQGPKGDDGEPGAQGPPGPEEWNPDWCEDIWNDCGLIDEHQDLNDLVEGRCGDHHYWLYGADENNVTYVRCGPGDGADSGPDRNIFDTGSGLGDAFGNLSIDVDGRALAQGAEYRALWDDNTCWLMYGLSGAQVRLDWKRRNLLDSESSWNDGEYSLDWENHKLGSDWWEVENDNPLWDDVEGDWSDKPALLVQGGIRSNENILGNYIIAREGFEIEEGEAGGHDRYNYWSRAYFKVDVSDELALLTNGDMSLYADNYSINGDAYEFFDLDVELAGGGGAKTIRVLGHEL